MNDENYLPASNGKYIQKKLIFKISSMRYEYDTSPKWDGQMAEMHDAKRVEEIRKLQILETPRQTGTVHHEGTNTVLPNFFLVLTHWTIKLTN